MTVAEIVTTVTTLVSDLGILPFIAGGAFLAIAGVGISRLFAAAR